MTLCSAVCSVLNGNWELNMAQCPLLRNVQHVSNCSFIGFIIQLHL